MEKGGISRWCVLENFRFLEVSGDIETAGSFKIERTKLFGGKMLTCCCGHTANFGQEFFIFILMNLINLFRSLSRTLVFSHDCQQGRRVLG